MVGILFIGIIFIGCGENKTDEVDSSGAPTLPPQYSIVPDFGDLEDTRSAAGAAGFSERDLDFAPMADGPCVIDNYLHASAQVGIWNLILRVTLAVPVWSFAEAFNHTPQQQEDGSWVWTYSAHIPSPNGVLHTAELHGEIIDARVYWEMYITKEGFYEDFLWYSGESDWLATEGTWTLRKSPDDDVDWLGIEWNRTPSDGTWQVSYTNIEPGGSENGGYIEYGITTDVDYDAYYNIYVKSADNLVEIQANRSSNTGRVKNANHFGDDDWHYWDESHCDDDSQ
jgi:hypothetical protein